MLLLFLTQFVFAQDPVMMGQLHQVIHIPKTGSFAQQPAIMQSFNRGPDPIVRKLEKIESIKQEAVNRLKDLKQQSEALHKTRLKNNLPEPKRIDPIESIKRAQKMDLSQIPDVEPPFQLKSSGEFYDVLSETLQNLSKARPIFDYQKRARTFGLNAIEEADQAFVDQNTEDAEYYQEIALDMLDIVVGIDPVTGMGRSVFEAATGVNLITGKDLSHFEHSMAFVGALTLGQAKHFTLITERIVKLSVRIGKAARLVDVIATSQTILTGTVKKVLLKIKQVGRVKDDSAYQFFDKTSQLNNRIPKNNLYARLVPRHVAEDVRLGLKPLSLKTEAFITAQEDIIKHIHDPVQIATKLALYENEAGTVLTDIRESVFLVFEIEEHLLHKIQKPIQSANVYKGFISGGKTKGGAREWIIDPHLFSTGEIDLTKIKIVEMKI